MVYARLCTMMFLQFAVWGAWAVVIGGHMEHNLGFEGWQIGLVFGTTAFGSLLSPLIAGWIADRFMPSQIFTGICHLLGAVLLYVAWHQTEFGSLWTVMFFYAVLYMPTIALTNGIAFHHMKDSGKFGNIRVWGTIGWICVQWLLAWYLTVGQKAFEDGQAGEHAYERHCFLFAAVAAVLMGLYSFSLPNTPPSKEAKNPYAFVEAFKLMRNHNVAVLLIISFVVAIELPFYYNLTYLFLTEKSALGGIGLEGGPAQFAMTLGQVAEILMMLLLWPTIRYGGMRMAIFLGILAWPVRYAIFAIGEPTWLVIAAQSLHGICYAFFFAGGMIAVEKLSHKEIRASAQGLLVFATSGAGMLIGHFVSGPIHDFCKLPTEGIRPGAMLYGLRTWLHNLMDTPEGGHTWAGVFMLPIVLTVIAGLVFLALWREREYEEDSERIAAEDAEAEEAEDAAEGEEAKEEAAEAGE